MSIRIGEDGTIISSEGDIQQGQNPLIAEDGTIRLGGQSIPVTQSSTTYARRPPASPFENGFSDNGSGNDEERISDALPSGTSSRAESWNSSRSADTIEYELQVKKAELNKCVRPIPIMVCVAFVFLAIVFSIPWLAVVSAIAAVATMMDLFKRSQISEGVRKLETELKKTRSRGG